MPVQKSRRKSLEESEIFHILGNDRRRAIVQILENNDGSIGVSEVASEIAEQESDSNPVPNNLYKSVYVSLQQTHLPHLEEEGVIEYDSDAKRIRSGPQFDDVRTYVDEEYAETILWFHLGLSMVGLAFVALEGVGVPGIARIDPLFVAVFVLLDIAVGSLYEILG